MSLSSLLLAAHAKVLAALSGEAEVATGYVVRYGAPALPCRVTTDHESWRALVLDTHRVESELLAHQDFPVDDLRHELGLTEPFFETVFDPTGTVADLCRGHRAVGRDLARTPTSSCCGCGTGPTCSTRTAAARIAGYHLTALALIAADPDAEHQRQSLLSAEELELPARRAGRAAPGAAGPPVPRAVRAAGRGHTRTPSRPCTGTGSGPTASSTPAPTGWDEPCWRAGCSREGVVAVVTERNLDWMAAVLAVFKAGGVYLPDRAALPGRSHRDHALPRRVRAGADRARQHDHARPGPRLAVRRPERSSSTRPTRRTSPTTPISASAVAPDQLAYIYFTSGSTGEPKGAMCEHAGMLNHLYAKIDDLEIGEGQVVAQIAPQCFDISLWQLVSALLVGGRTLLVEQEVILDVERFVDKIIDGRVAVLQVVPSYLEVVLSYLEEHPRELPDLRFVSVTGEALKKELAQRWFATLPATPGWSTRTG